MIVNLDSDGVVSEFVEPCVTVLRRTIRPHASPEPSVYAVHEEWGISLNTFMLLMEEHADVLFADAPEVPGAVDGVRQLVAAGHEVRIVSHKVWAERPRLTARAQLATVQWYDRHGLLPLVDLVLTSGNKQAYPADVVVDDKTDLSWRQSNRRNFLFTRSWNTSVSDRELTDRGVLRVRDWPELLEVLEVSR